MYARRRTIFFGIDEASSLRELRAIIYLYIFFIFGITRNLIELRETEIDALIRKGILKADARHLGKVGNWPSVAARATVSRAKNL